MQRIWILEDGLLEIGCDTQYSVLLRNDDIDMMLADPRSRIRQLASLQYCIGFGCVLHVGWCGQRVLQGS